MAVSDETGGKSPKLRKGCVFLKPGQWVAARYQYESQTCSDARSVELIMAQFNVSERTVRAKIASQGWKKGTALADEAANKLHQIVDANLEPIGQQIAERIGKKVESDMAPWFEREKVKHTRNALKLVKARQRMVNGIVESLESITPKDAAYIAKSDDTYDAIARRTLNMNESAGISGALSFRILTDSAAIEVSHS